ncbi:MULTISPECIES: molybdopterin cofactor-binding domain-containing protein [unclassified Lentimonas]|uniref:xanthine dehydrogenase family protein molybdopterin-binding subunit n=1 Tax=unclassified Lentimonas TaxID=2630993 RepID=UPI001321BCBF|nr:MULTISPECIES: molybdopterin cofactor-binding domain-containing protein [unclassified Lentimonas]CAA6690678.1 Isoquinoline 1-oxidoreductase beta subunit (EC [Lentimonas sp. CC19]CAA6693399.1 Isoquinoline 1-oxidoreductase beta subunit (EC [Lentimonas sp. CC10]CAA7071858.1 Isoquinoline 1-oxidoreductase beta subunit (EC [Lentimonas sp. CC11]
MKTILCSRRDFLKATGLSAAGLVLGFRAAQAASPADSEFKPNAYIVISEASGVLLYIPIPEIGQNIRTTFAMVLADELGADLNSVTLKQAPPQADIGHQNAGGSNSVRRQYLPLREAAAIGREMLIAAAAKEWGAQPKDCRVDASIVYGPSDVSMPFTQAAKLAIGQPVPTSAPLKPASEFKYIGQATRCLDTTDIVTGQMTFGIDAYPKELAYAVLLRSPVHQGQLKSFDASAAKAMPSVKDIFQVGNAVAVIATNTWAAMNASRVVSVKWDEGENATLNTETLDQQRIDAVTSGNEITFKKGNFDNAYSNAAIQLESEFYIPTIAHATLEPPNCTAWFHNGRVEIWGSCQMLGRLHKQLPRITGLPHEKITYHQLRIGGGFGRKLEIDYVEEGIAIAKQVDYPVKMIFTREDDIRHDRYRAPDQYKFRIGLSQSGFPEAIEEVNVLKPKKRASELARFFDTIAMKHTTVPSGLPSGWLRAPGHNVTSFAEQSMIDIMAEKSGIDPIDYQLALHGDAETVRKLGWKNAPANIPEICELLKIVKQRSNWKGDSNFGYGLSTFTGYGSYSAVVALVSKSGGSRPVERVYAAVNCGTVINPLGAHAQVEGGIIDALGATLYQNITLKKGRVVQSNYHDFKLLRIAEHPEVDVHFVESDAKPQGLGEVSYPAMPAATTNALYAATGKRITKLPLRS